MSNPIEEYVISLGFSVSARELRSFQDALALAGKAASNVTAGFVSDIFKWQIAVTTAFGGIATALIGLADHVAEQDQEWRLFGLRMNLSTEHAKSLKIAMDALGQPLEVIAWDPEIHGRFLQLIEDQKQLQAGLGNGRDLEAEMRTIRDVRFEVTRLRVELQYLGAALISKLFESFGTSVDDVLKKLREWNDWIIQNLPLITDRFAKYLMPILKDTWEVGKDLWEVISAGAVALTNLIGLLSGDTSIESSTLKFENLAKAISHVLNFLDGVLRGLTEIETIIGHVVSITSLLLGGQSKEAGGMLDQLLEFAGGSTPRRVDDFRHENTSPFPFTGSSAARGIRNNNPGNIEYGDFARGEGSTGRETQGRFATFSTGDQGLKALADLLGRYGSQGNDTVRGILSKYSPSGENGSANTNSYIANVARSLGVSDTAHLNLSDPSIKAGLMNAIIRQENGGNPYSSDQVARAAGVSIGDIHVHLGGSTNASAGEIGHEVKRQVREVLNQEITRTSAQYSY